MTYYFIYTNIGNGPRPQDKFDFGTMRSAAPSASYEIAISPLHKVGGLLNNDLQNAVVVTIQNETEAIVFKMMQDTFIYHMKNKPKLEYVLIDVDWNAVLAEGAAIPLMVKEQENRRKGQLNVTRMTKLFDKFYDCAIGNTKVMGMEHNDELTKYSQTLDKLVEEFRANNKAETAKIAKERAKVKKKLLSYKVKK